MGIKLPDPVVQDWEGMQRNFDALAKIVGNTVTIGAGPPPSTTPPGLYVDGDSPTLDLYVVT